MGIDGYIILGLIVGIYLVPTITATRKNHRNASAITVLNVLTGWTLIGWLAALIWALTDGSKPASKAEEMAELIRQMQALQGDKK